MELKFENAYFEYLKYIENRQKVQSKRNLKERFENKILPFFKDYSISSIKEVDYVKWQNWVDRNNYSNNYRENLHYLMTSFFDYCMKFYGLEKNIARIVGQFKKKNETKEYHVYDKKQFKRFIKFINDDVIKEFFKTMFLTGLRPGEAMALKFSDLNNGFLSITKTIDEHCDKETKQRMIGTPKTFTSIRNVRIAHKHYRSLIKLKGYYDKKYNMENYDYFIFGGTKPLSPTTINRYKLKACEKANLIPIKLHEFRHSHATLLLKEKVLINEIARRLGHSDVAMTLNIYTHTDLSQEKRVIKTLNSLRL